MRNGRVRSSTFRIPSSHPLPLDPAFLAGHVDATGSRVLASLADLQALGWEPDGVNAYPAVTSPTRGGMAKDGVLTKPSDFTHGFSKIRLRVLVAAVAALSVASMEAWPPWATQRAIC